MYINRLLENEIIKASKAYPVVMVYGQRQVGKSTMLNHIKENNRKYVTLDDGKARRLAINDPSLFFETYGYPLLIDEFQRVPSLLLEIKKIIDQSAIQEEDNNGLFWLTGSENFLMNKEVSESLAGRVAIFNMAGLSKAEIENRNTGLFNPELDNIKERLKEVKNKNVHKIYEDIFKGSMPELFNSNIDRENYYMNYINTYIEKDIKNLLHVDKLDLFYNFLVYIASRTAQELKYNDIASTLGISIPTAKAWVNILLKSGIIFLLKPYYSDLTKRLIKTPKLYFMDTGLIAYLCNWPSAKTLESGAMDGAILETYVVSEIVKSYLNASKRLDLYYYRDTDQKEIDLLIDKGEDLYPIEIKKSKEPASPDKNFTVLKKLNKNIKPGLIICMSDILIPYNRNCYYCPISVL